MGYFGSSALSDIKLGSSDVSKVYAGSNLVWSAGGGGGDTSVSLLLHMDGSDGSTSFIDSSTYNKTVTRVGTPTLSTAQSPAFQSSSGVFNGSTDALRVAHDSTLDLSGGPWTIEMWAYMNVTETTVFYDQGASGDRSIRLYYTTSNNGWTTYLYNASQSFTSLTITDSTPAGAWHHIAITYDGSIVRAYKNGFRGKSIAYSPGTLHSTSSDLYIGATATNSSELNGYLADLRVTKGVAQYVTDTSFTVPGQHPNP